MEIKRRLIYIMFVIFCVIWAGSFGYYFIFKAQYGFMTCLYMTVISLTTVGYGEVIEAAGNVPAELFTIRITSYNVCYTKLLRWPYNARCSLRFVR